MSKNKLSLAPFDPSAGRKDRTVNIKKVARLVEQRTGKVKPCNDDPEAMMKFDWVEPDFAFINYVRQRYPEPSQVKKLDKKWKTYVITPLQARKDSNGHFYIADGQQHGVCYILKFPGKRIPIFYYESDDPNVESEMLLALNTDSMPMARYFIHDKQVQMGHKLPIAIEATVRKADCEMGYKIKRPGAITHITDLYIAEQDYGLEALYKVLVKYRLYWPNEQIKTATMMGFLKVKFLMEQAGVFTDELFDDVFAECAAFFQSADRLQLDIKDEFAITYPTNYKGMGVKEKIASGIINVYENATSKTLVNSPFIINMPAMVTTNVVP